MKHLHSSASHRIVPALLLAFACLSSPSARASDAAAPHWSYGGKDNGAAQWGDLDSKFESCAIGKAQSPIDIRGAVASKLPALQPDYPALAPSWVNNGHTIQVNLPEGAALTVGDARYKLLQFHFHTPSEEAINGKRFDLVAHFVHRDDQGRLGVIAVLFKRGKPNAAWGQVLAHLPRDGETIGVQGLNLGLASLLPPKLGYYAFEGSLTTPPCSEGVSWMVLKTPVEISGAQLATFRKLYSANARPLQPLNGRVIRASAE